MNSYLGQWPTIRVRRLLSLKKVQLANARRAGEVLQATKKNSTKRQIVASRTAKMIHFATSDFLNTTTHSLRTRIYQAAIQRCPNHMQRCNQDIALFLRMRWKGHTCFKDGTRENMSKFAKCEQYSTKKVKQSC